ncbi:MAG: hypothetical protein A2378_04115 [Candidatus Pacebacteria bacterium RIFOXYB1_FULL_44_10]|nr:MAG: hypothetical protein A2378_04115 [Candidatus Pacebacteria bacterium RIFOXYB1_FULL_44_10]
MTYPHLLCLSQHSTMRREYLQFVESLSCEVKVCSTIEEALVQCVVSLPNILILDDSFSVYEVSVLVRVFQEKKDWQTVSMFVVGNVEKHLFPKETVFVQSIHELVNSLKDVFDTLYS